MSLFRDQSKKKGRWSRAKLLIKQRGRKKDSTCPGKVGGWLGLGYPDRRHRAPNLRLFFFDLVLLSSPSQSRRFLRVRFLPSPTLRSVSPTSRHSRRSRCRESGSTVRRGWLLLLACFKNSERNDAVVTSVAFSHVASLRPAHPRRLIFSENGEWRNRLTNRKQFPSERDSSLMYLHSCVCVPFRVEQTTPFSVTLGRNAAVTALVVPSYRFPDFHPTSPALSRRSDNACGLQQRFILDNQKSPGVPISKSWAQFCHSIFFLPFFIAWIDVDSVWFPLPVSLLLLAVYRQKERKETHVPELARHVKLTINSRHLCFLIVWYCGEHQPKMGIRSFLKFLLMALL